MRPQERGWDNGVLTAINVKRTVPNCHIDGIVGCKFSEDQVLCPLRRIPLDIWPQEIFQGLDDPFQLTICLWVESRAEPKINTKQVK